MSTRHVDRNHLETEFKVQLLDYSEFYREKLVEYCHSEECTKLLECPEQHEKCKEKLGLDTAIAWELYRHISKYMTTVNQPSYYNELVKERMFKSLYIATTFAVNIVRLHKDKYKTLFNILCELLQSYEFYWKKYSRLATRKEYKF